MATILKHNDQYRDVKDLGKTAGAITLGGLTGGWGGAAAGLAGGFGGVGEHYLNEQARSRNKEASETQRSRRLQGLEQYVPAELASAIVDQEPSVQVQLLKNYLTGVGNQTQGRQDADMGEKLAEQLGYLKRPVGRDEEVGRDFGFTPQQMIALAQKRIAEAPQGHYSPQQTEGLTREQARFRHQFDKGFEKYGKAMTDTRALHQPRLDAMRDSEKNAEQQISQSRDLIGILKSGKADVGSLRQQLPQWAQNLGATQGSNLYDMVSKDLQLSKLAGLKGKNANAAKDAIESSIGTRLNSPEALETKLKANIHQQEKVLALGKAREAVLKKYAGAPLPEDLEDRITRQAKPEVDRIDRRLKDLFNPMAREIAKDSRDRITPLKEGATRDVSNLQQAEDMFLPGETFSWDGERRVRTENGSQVLAGSKKKSSKGSAIASIAGAALNPGQFALNQIMNYTSEPISRGLGAALGTPQEWGQIGNVLGTPLINQAYDTGNDLRNIYNLAGEYQ